MCDWIDWRERVPNEGEAGFVIFRNMVTKKVWIQNSTVVSGKFWYDNEPLAWLPFPKVPDQYKGNLP